MLWRLLQDSGIVGWLFSVGQYREEQSWRRELNVHCRLSIVLQEQTKRVG